MRSRQQKLPIKILYAQVCVYDNSNNVVRKNMYVRACLCVCV